MTEGGDRRLLAIGAVLAGTGVALGAFGAHALQTILDARQLDWWQTAVSYQMWHAIALIGLGSAPVRGRTLATILLVVGTVLFSGSLYLLALLGWRWLGLVTPLGGTLLLAGWGYLLWRLLRGR